jgi:5-methylcytosine-specific restriction endonuclease McrA
MASQLQRSRLHAFDHQGGRCYYCGLPMLLDGQKGPPQLRCTAEHLTAHSEGGKAGQANIVAACLHCNRTRHKRKRPPEPDRYRAEVRRRVERGAWVPAPVRAWARKRQASG